MHTSNKIALICGGGVLPQQIAQACRDAGESYVLIILEGHQEASWIQEHPHFVIRLGAIGKILKTLKNEKVSRITLAGTVSRPSLAQLKPDLTALKWLALIGARGGGDDGMLSEIIQLIGREGYEVVAPHALVPGLLVSEGCLTRMTPSPEDLKDLKKGFVIAKALGRHDIGQAVIVEKGVILSLEGIEGTAALIHRTAPLKRGSGASGVLVKAAKPQQTLLVDLPSIGPDTLDQIKACQLKGIGLEVARSQILKKEQTLKKANDLGLFIVGIQEEASHD